MWEYIFVANADSEGPDQTAQYAQSDLGLRCPLAELLDIVECIDVQRRSLSDCVASLDDLDFDCSQVLRTYIFPMTKHM